MSGYTQSERLVPAVVHLVVIAWITGFAISGYVHNHHVKVRTGVVCLCVDREGAHGCCALVPSSLVSSDYKPPPFQLTHIHPSELDG